MSADAIHWARYQMTGLHDGPYLLLLVLALKHRDGPIREPLEWIAGAAHMSVSTVKRHLVTLSGLGVLDYTPGLGRGFLSTVTLHLEKAVTVESFSEKRSAVTALSAVKRSRVNAFMAEKRSEKRSPLTAFPPLHPPIRNKHYLNGKGTENDGNGIPTPREAVFAELAQLQRGDLMPTDLTPRALSVLSALPEGHGWQHDAVIDAYIRTEVDDE